MDEFFSLEFVSGIRLSFRDSTLISMKHSFPNPPLAPHSTPICRCRLAQRACRRKKEKSKVLWEIWKKEKEARVGGGCLEERG